MSAFPFQNVPLNRTDSSNEGCFENFTFEYDDDGCHDTRKARNSCLVQNYLSIKYILGIMGLCKYSHLYSSELESIIKCIIPQYNNIMENGTAFYFAMK